MRLVPDELWALVEPLVPEFQARPQRKPPAWATADLLETSVRAAAVGVTVNTVRPDGASLQLVWGGQVDIRPILRTSDVEDDDGQISEQRLAGYIAKYATKGTGKTEAADHPIRSQLDIDHLRVSDHHRRMIQTAWDLGELESHADLNLRRWAHMLGFRGHFLTKSRAYSTTFKTLRGDRQAHRLTERLTSLGIPVEELRRHHRDQRLGVHRHRLRRRRRTGTRRRHLRTHPTSTPQPAPTRTGISSMNAVKLWGIKDVAEYLGVPEQTIYQWRTKGYGPPGRRVGKYVKYSPADVEQWFKALPAEVA
jgi:predicted DNA-binding transcriptional regulator AlpA